MFKMFTQLWSAFTVFFMALEKLAKATNHLSTWAEESAGSFADEARVNRTARLASLNKEAGTEITTTNAG